MSRGEELTEGAVVVLFEKNSDSVARTFEMDLTKQSLKAQVRR